MNLDVCVEYDPWSRSDVKAITDECVMAVFAELKLNHYNVEICFLFTDDKELHVLNKTYCGIDNPTNVLSFPADSLADIPTDDEYDDNDCYCNSCILGSVAMAYETIERESVEQGKAFEEHLKHMIVHSVLHLLGYDHSNPPQAERMEQLEIKILGDLNIANPYS
ncbi:MAG: rRNA maturation RNase YbeY [Holosporaceae bacterium]|jgi:probable rRNA maturation factor|nr:rRNA maturation RNase YbeY [Holosporaceae bacterium]